jgi:hypothetical protein
VECINLFRREKSLRNPLPREIRADTFKIDTEFPMEGKRIESETMGMRHIETEPVASRIGCQRGLSKRGVAKLQLRGVSIEVSGEDFAEHSSGDDETSSVPRKAEPSSASLFVQGESLREFP